MSRRIACALVVLIAAVLVAPAGASALIYRGAANADPQMPVKVNVSGSDVTFTYSSVLVDCSDGSRVRQGGAVHTGRINEAGRFKDALEVEGEDGSEIDYTVSVVRGKVTAKRAVGTVRYDLEYADGDCASGVVAWSAKRR